MDRTRLDSTTPQNEPSPVAIDVMLLDDSKQSALSYRDFRLFLAMRLPSNVGSQMQSVAIGWQVYDITRQPLDLGFVGLAQFLPVFGFALVAGHVADRFERRRILTACYSVQLLCSLLFLAFALSGLQSVWPIYAVLFLFGSARAFSAPASQALIPNLVPKKHLGNAVAWSSSGFQVATIAGPAAGGFVYALGAPVVYAMAGALFMLAIFATTTMKARMETRLGEGFSWHTLIAGLNFVRSRRELLGAISLDLFAVLFGGATALLPIFARDILQTGPQGLGILRSAPAIGAMVLGVMLAHYPVRRQAGRVMFACVATFGIATILFGVSQNFFLSLAALMTLGAADMVSVFVRQNLVQRATPDEMRGRVGAISTVFVVASNELGEMESGLTAAWLGTVESVVLGGIGTLIVVGLWMWRFPQLRDIDKLDEVKTASDA